MSPKALLILVILGFSSCGKKIPSTVNFDPGAMEGKAWEPGAAGPAGDFAKAWDSVLATGRQNAALTPIAFHYPRTNTVFPPGFTPPLFSWSDSTSKADFWIVQGVSPRRTVFQAFTASPSLSAPAVDSTAIPPNTPMEIPDPNRFRNWRPDPLRWKAMQAYGESTYVLNFYGFRSSRPTVPVSHGKLEFRTSRDPVGAPIFYRDVPIMPTRNESGRVQPLSRQAERLIRWSLRDVTRPENKTMIEGLPTCANCHSFSRDGGSIGLDLDGPQNDKGTYGLAKLARQTDITRKDAFSWNESFKAKANGDKTIGFLSSVSPDGRHVVTTVNEQVYIHNYLQNKYIQVFFPTRGILAFYEKGTGKVRALPGADDTAFVHCDPTWSPDGKHIVFARARAKDPYHEGQPDPQYPNDPNETQIQYDLYRIPFNGGKGGKAEPVAGAAGNGMSNNFPKITPDGKRIVFVKCRNGQLLRPDSKLWMVPVEGGEARLMDCNLEEMNSWHSFSPNGRWMVFSSKGFTHYTQMFLTHIDADGMDSPPVLVENATKANRAVNLPEFVNRPYEDLDRIEVSAISHLKSLQDAYDLLETHQPQAAKAKMRQALEEETEDRKFRSQVQVLLGWLQDSLTARIAGTREAIRTDPENSLAYFNLGSLLEAQGNPMEAMRSYGKSVSLDPKNAWARVGLARLHMQSEDPRIRDSKKAVALAEEANRVSKYREPSIMKTLARTYSEVGRFEDAMKTVSYGLELARQQGLAGEVKELEVEFEVYRLGKSFTWALKNSGGPDRP